MYANDEKFPYRIIFDTKAEVQDLEMYRWTKKQFGGQIGPDAVWECDIDNLRYSFKNETDRSYFLLRWG